jgi:polysaccharide biosynthesis/export protein
MICQILGVFLVCSVEFGRADIREELIRFVTLLSDIRRRGGAMSFSKWILAGIVFCIVLIPAIGRCAQSSADVSATKELKETARKEILGTKSRDTYQGEEYIIGNGDLLSVSIFGEGDMAAVPVAAGPPAAGQHAAGQPAGGANTLGSVEVRIDGQISLKHIGDVKASGMTLTQLADYLKKLYAPLIDDPTVTTVLIKSNSRKYSVMGKVLKPGVFPIDFQISLVQAIARCEGFNEWANREVTVVRKDVHERDRDLFKRNTLEFDYSDFLKGKDLNKNIYIQADDIIVAH